MKGKRVLSGIQPSGGLHLGNYFGMMKPMIELQEENELFCFLVNYHALTSVTDAEKLSRDTLEAAADFLALGLDPEKAVFWVCLLYTSPSPRDVEESRMPSSA